MNFRKIRQLVAGMLVCASIGVSAQARIALNDDVNQVFITINDASQIATLQEMGVTVTGVFDGLVTALVPADNMDAVWQMGGVIPARRLDTCCDSVRYYTHVDEVQAGTDLSMPYTGSGVIIGVIDCGFDFNHINLCDANGATRVRAVYMPYDNSGTAPVVNGYTLPGSCYEDAAAIAQLTTDDASTTHGTQTAGIAAGGYRTNGWHGMAPDAELVLCGMAEGQLSDYNVANCVNYIIDYAQRMGKPCVINISLGTNVGAHDGTSPLTRVCDQLSGAGRICVVSAGNDGYVPARYRHTLSSSTDTATTLLRGYYAGLQHTGYVSVWGKAEQAYSVRFIVVDRNSGEVVYASPFANTDNYLVSLSSDNDEALAAYVTGEVELTALSTASGRQHTVVELKATATGTDHYLGLQYATTGTADITAWSSLRSYFFNFGMNGVGSGSEEGTISDLATGDSIISVGAYCSRQTVPLRDGSTYWRERSVPTTIAYFSAYGPDENGVQRPDVCAPGTIVVSSANRYDTDAPNISYWQPSAVVDGVEYPYCPDLGTSLSAPTAAGVIALWLQADPTLGASAVRNVLRLTSDKDSNVRSGDSNRWGYGKLNALAGIRYVINGYLKGDVNADGEVTIADVNAIIDIILGSTVSDEMMQRADVNEDGEVTIADVNAVIDIILS